MMEGSFALTRRVAAECVQPALPAHATGNGDPMFRARSMSTSTEIPCPVKCVWPAEFLVVSEFVPTGRGFLRIPSA